MAETDLRLRLLAIVVLALLLLVWNVRAGRINWEAKATQFIMEKYFQE